MTETFLDHPAVRVAGALLRVALCAVLGIFLYVLMFWTLVSTGMLAADMDGEGYGVTVTRQAVIVWVASLLVAAAGLFIRAGWRWPLIAAPAYAPALYLLMVVLAG